MKTMRSLSWILVLFLAITVAAQERRETPAPTVPPGGDFGSKFFVDLHNLFGELKQTELDSAFRKAVAIRCSDLTGGKGQWKEVAFLNDDRTLGDWHHESIDQVRQDLVSFVFSGACFDDQGTIKIATSFPIQETLDRFRDGKIPFSQILISDNPAVSVNFNRSDNAYTFVLPYLYLEKLHSTNREPLFTMSPPLTTSQPDRTVSEEFRCKAVRDPELTYRFILCRTRVVDRDPQLQRQAEAHGKDVLGAAAYWILSDGREATATVKLTFDHSVDTSSAEEPVPSAGAARADVPPPAPPPTVSHAGAPVWKAASPQARLVDISQLQFRLRFNPRVWSGRVQKAQELAAQTITAAAISGAAANREVCTWRPDSTTELTHLLDPGDESTLFTLDFKKELGAASSVSIDVSSFTTGHLGMLQCYFPRNNTPDTITVARFTAIVGDNIVMEIRAQ